MRLNRHGLMIVPVIPLAILVARVAIPLAIVIPMFSALRASWPALLIAVAVTAIGPQHAAAHSQDTCEHDQQGCVAY